MIWESRTSLTISGGSDCRNDETTVLVLENKQPSHRLSASNRLRRPLHHYTTAHSTPAGHTPKGGRQGRCLCRIRLPQPNILASRDSCWLSAHFDKTSSVQHLIKHAGMDRCIDTKPPLVHLLPLMIYAELCIWQMICIMHRNDVHQLLSAPYIYRKLYRMFIEVGLMLANLNSLPRA